MENFQKLNRAEMKNVTGGVSGPPPSCKDECQTYDDCPGDEICIRVNCLNTDYFQNQCG